MVRGQNISVVDLRISISVYTHSSDSEGSAFSGFELWRRFRQGADGALNGLQAQALAPSAEGCRGENTDDEAEGCGLGNCDEGEGARVEAEIEVVFVTEVDIEVLVCRWHDRDVIRVVERAGAGAVEGEVCGVEAPGVNLAAVEGEADELGGLEAVAQIGGATDFEIEGAALGVKFCSADRAHKVKGGEIGWGWIA